MASVENVNITIPVSRDWLESLSDSELTWFYKELGFQSELTIYRLMDKLELQRESAAARQS